MRINEKSRSIDTAVCVCVCESTCVTHTKENSQAFTLLRPTRHPTAAHLDHSPGRCHSLQTHKDTNNKTIPSPSRHTHTHTSTSTHVELFTVQDVVPSLSPHCVITELLNPCGSVMTDCDAGTEREASHDRKTQSLCLIFTMQLCLKNNVASKKGPLS